MVRIHPFLPARLGLYALRPGRRPLKRNDRVSDSPLYDDVRKWQDAQMESMTFENDRPVKAEKGTVDLAPDAPHSPAHAA